MNSSQWISGRKKSKRKVILAREKMREKLENKENRMMNKKVKSGKANYVFVPMRIKNVLS